MLNRISTVLIITVVLFAASCSTAPDSTQSAPAAAEESSSIALTWLGHATFILNTGAGTKVLIDPMAEGMGYTVNPVQDVDLVTISHEHGDHNNADAAVGDPVVLRGLTEDGWAEIDQTINDVHVRTVPSYHDDQQGASRGRNAIFVLEAGGLKIAHLGDLGHQLDEDQIQAIASPDILLIPIGGGPTLDGKGAVSVVSDLNPKVIIPMHYATAMLPEAMRERFGSAEDFVAAFGDPVEVIQAGHTVALSSGELPASQTLMVMNYE